ncbi:hypothetical protein DP939_00640 [Spongiactinospora rosea]|uniref:Uncharacterized protein n=1 Tax=Spongiactinospora rosea TaxID=2248750 RepID=A0A366M6B6_9ACTN|nr:hypothetical protein [Spongiactinospora rosea]RBQ21270.1 hypothetical protein DP939_00640 [Spongiactinospora rosea]
MDELGRRFHRAMVTVYETAKRELGYDARRFLQMLSEHGGVATAKQLVWADTPSDGFTTLWTRGRLDLTVEAHMVQAEYESLFTEEERLKAARRLDDYGWTEHRRH